MLVDRDPGASLFELLGELEALGGVVECRTENRGWWRASALAAEAIEESYADRSPLLDDAGAPRRP